MALAVAGPPPAPGRALDRTGVVRPAVGRRPAWRAGRAARPRRRYPDRHRAVTRAARRLGVSGRILRLGHVGDRARLATLMATCDCLVHPNPTEPYGLAPIEAIAARCRVVAPRTVGSAEALGANGANLVAPGDARALAAGVRRAMSEPRPRPQLRAHGWDGVFTREWQLYDRMRRSA